MSERGKRVLCSWLTQPIWLALGICILLLLTGCV